jgi:hypothetical protein
LPGHSSGSSSWNDLDRGPAGLDQGASRCCHLFSGDRCHPAGKLGQQVRIGALLFQHRHLKRASEHSIGVAQQMGYSRWTGEFVTRSVLGYPAM